MELKNKIRIIKVGGYDELKKRISEFTIGWNDSISFRYRNDNNLIQSKVGEIISAKEHFLVENLPKQ